MVGGEGGTEGEGPDRLGMSPCGERVDGAGVDGDVSSTAAMRLGGFACGGAVGADGDRCAYGDGPGGEVDRIPGEGGDFSAAHPGGDGEPCRDG